MAAGLAGCNGGPTEEAVETKAEVATPSPEPRRIPIEVEYGETAEHTLAKGECHVLELEIEADRYVEMEIEQLGIDVATELVPPGGGETVRFDAPVGASRPELGAFVSEGAGMYRLDVCPGAIAAARGTYRVRIEEPGIPSPAERALADGFRSYSRGGRYADAGETREAEDAFGRALERFRKAGARRPEGWTLSKLGWLARLTEELETAEACFLESARIHAEFGDVRQEAYSLSYLGTVLTLQDRFEEAMAVHARSLRAAETSADAKLILGAVGNLAQVSETAGYTLQAVELQHRRRELARRDDDPRTEWEALTRLAKIYLYSGQGDQAIQLFEEAVAVARTHDLDEEVVKTSEDLGRAYLARDEASRAVKHFEEALEIRRTQSDQKAVAETLNNLGRCYRRLGERQRAHAALEEARSVVREVAEDSRLEAFINLNLASVLFDEGDFRGAVEPCERALAALQDDERPRYITGALRCLARARRGTGELDRAVEHIREAVEILEIFRSRSALDDLRAQFLADFHAYYELYVDLLVELENRRPGSGYAADAFEMAERSKARTLLDGLAQAETAIRWRADPGLVAREAALQEEMSDVEQSLLHGRLQEDPPEGIEALDRRLRALRNEHALVVGQILADSPEWSALLATEPSTIEEIQTDLLADGDTQLVSFLLGKERSHAWIVGPDSVHVEPLPARHELESLGRQAARLLARSDQPHLLLQAELTVELLAREVWVPLIPHLSSRRIILAKDGALHLVPFGVLPLPGGDGSSGQLLTVDRFELVEVPSASAAVVLRRRHAGRPAASRRAAVLADPVFEPDDERLRAEKTVQRGSLSQPMGASASEPSEKTMRGGLGPFKRLTGSAEETRFISTLVAPDDLLLATDFDASRDLLLSGELRDFRILHFSGHGLGDAGLTGIVLSLFDRAGHRVDGLVQPYEIHGLRLSADLVVLSACRTGLGQEIRGEGLLGLNRAFLLSGASQVLASLWDVDDAATAELMKRFYGAYLRDGETPSRALRSAHRSMRRDPRWGAPHYWAGFVLQGAGS